MQSCSRAALSRQVPVSNGDPVLYMRSPDGKIFDVDNPPRKPDADKAEKLSAEQLTERRIEYMIAAQSGLHSAEVLETLTQQGSQLVAELKDDNELAVQV